MTHRVCPIPGADCLVLTPGLHSMLIDASRNTHAAHTYMSLTRCVFCRILSLIFRRGMQSCPESFLSQERADAGNRH